MPNDQYYSDIKILKKPLNKKVKRVFKFFLFLLVCVSCFFGARYFSKVLTVGNLGALIVYGDTTYKCKPKKYYAISLGKYDNFAKAEEVALGSTIQGAGGFVWQENNDFYVLGNVYNNEQDALSVLENLKDAKYDTSIKTIELREVKLDFSMYDNSDMMTIKKGFDILNEVYSKLYQYSIDFDKGEVTNLAVSSYISELRGDVKGIIIDIQNLINKSSSKLTIIQTALIKLDELLDQTIIKVIDNTSTNYSLKYSICSVVKFQFDMVNELCK